MLRALVVAGLVTLSACSSDDPYVTQTNTASGNSGSHTHTATVSGSSGATTSGAGTTSGSGTTSGAVTSGTIGTVGSGSSGSNPACPAGANPVLSDCSTGQVELLTQVVEFPGNTPITTGVTFQDFDNQSQATSTDTDGILRVCVDPGTTLSPYVSDTGFETTIFNDFDLTTSECFNQIPLIQTNEFGELLTGIMDLDVAKAAVVVVGRVAPGAGPCDLTGWTYWAMADGGSVDAEEVYVSGVNLQPSTDGTGSSGVALLYNIDPSLKVISIFGGQDGGYRQGSDYVHNCVNTGLVAAEYTGTIHIQPEQSGISSFTFLVGDAG